MSKSAGRSGSRWRRLKADLREQNGPCFHCGQPINYQAKWPSPESFSVDHLKPLSKYPELAQDPGNLAASHLHCNQVKGVGEAKPGLGNKSEEW